MSPEGSAVPARAVPAPVPPSGSGHRDEPGTLRVANEFADVVVRLVATHNGVRLEVASPRLGRAVLLDALQLEALTWQEPETFSAFLDEPFGPAAARAPRAAR